MMSLHRVVIPTLILSSACATDLSGTTETEAARHALRQPLHPATSRVLDSLNEAHPDAAGSLWSLSRDNALPTEWVVQTPLGEHWSRPLSELEVARSCSARQPQCDPDFALLRCDSDADCTDGGTCQTVAATVTTPGQQPARLCVGHSDAVYDRIYQVIVEAERHLDISSLTPPDGRFEAAIRNGLTYLANANREVDVRLLFGHVIGDPTATASVRDTLVRDFPADAEVRVWVGAYRLGLDSWNHSKIIAADGEVVLQGGHNMWTEHYLTQAPVHDLSMTLRGGAAADAQVFLNELWDFTCRPAGWRGRTDVDAYAADGRVANCPPPFMREQQAAADDGVPVVSVGRTGRIGDDPADTAILSLLSSAQRSMRLSVQDLGPVRVGWFTIGGWPEPVLRELGAAVLRGVDVWIVVSGPGARPGGLTGASANYGNGWEAEDVVRKVSEYITRHPEIVPAGVDVRSTLCERLHVATIRRSGEDAWPDGTLLGNHAKFMMVDESVFYLGSQNLYYSDLAEFGFIVDSATESQRIVQEYWDPMWAESSRVAVSGYEAARCVLED